MLPLTFLSLFVKGTLSGELKGSGRRQVTDVTRPQGFPIAGLSGAPRAQLPSQQRGRVSQEACGEEAAGLLRGHVLVAGAKSCPLSSILDLGAAAAACSHAAPTSKGEQCARPGLC